MPIVVKDFIWKQISDKISIQVPLRGTPTNKVDIFTSPQYIKASFGSFLFEVLLLYEVDISQSNCTKSSTCILFDLKKYEEKFWESLEIEDISKEERQALKNKLIQEEHERIQKLAEEKRIKKAELKKVAVNAQINLETKVRAQIEEIKKSEESRALGDLNSWKASIEENSKSVKITEIHSDDEENKTIDVNKNTNLTQPQTKKLPKRKPFHKSEYQQQDSRSSSIPKPRNVRCLQILFTPRDFPTPSRESRLEEENEFLAKQAEARRSVGFVDEDLRPEEKNPQFLLAKGNDFIKNENYLGAISAFTFGIKLSPKFVDLYIARSGVHITVGNFNRTVEDCTSALSLLKPVLPINLNSRAVCLGRRGLALFKLGFLKQGISELEYSVKLDKRTEFKAVLEECRMEYEKLSSRKEKENSESENKVDKTE